MTSKTIGFTISVVARTLKVHPQTLRLYERRGLLQPSRSEGNTRLYAESDIERLRVILNLTRELGVNLAGVEVVLNMREKMLKMRQEMENLSEYLSSNSELDPEWLRRKLREALVPAPPSKLARSDKSRRG